MKNILLAYPQAQIDPPLRRCIAHLANSCQIEIAHNGYEVLEMLNHQTFDLIIIDFTIPDIDALELAESIQYIDPGVPVIVTIPQAHQAISDAVLKLKAYPIIRPFKPISFLRLIDQLLHQHLNRYRHLAQTLTDNLDRLRVHLHATSSFLVDDSGYVIISTGTLPEPLLKTLVQLITKWQSNSADANNLQPSEFTDSLAESAAGLYYATITGNLHLAVVVPSPSHSHPSTKQIWLLLKQVIADIRKALKLYIGITTAMLNPNPQLSRYHFIPYQYIAPLLLNPPLILPPNEEDDVTINWQNISRESGILNRLHEFCRINQP